MRVVVTGAAGFIGSHTCELLAARGHGVIGLDSFDDYLYDDGPKRENARGLAKLDGVKLIEGDICDAARVADAITDDVDVVCHLAALAGVRPSIAQPWRYVRTNIVGTSNVIERMREHGLQRLVFASSSSVYGARPESAHGFREDDPCVRQVSPYASTKRMNEIQLAPYCNLFGLGVLALRYFTAYGPRQRPDMAIHKFTRAIARGEAITVFGDGNSRRDYTYIDDIVAGTVAAIERVAPGDYELVNLGDSATTSLSELVALIERVVGKHAIINRQPDQPGDVPLTFANIAKARALLDYSPGTRLDDGIARFWEWLRRDPALTDSKSAS